MSTNLVLITTPSKMTKLTIHKWGRKATAKGNTPQQPQSPKRVSNNNNRAFKAMSNQNKASKTNHYSEDSEDSEDSESLKMKKPSLFQSRTSRKKRIHCTSQSWSAKQSWSAIPTFSNTKNLTFENFRRRTSRKSTTPLKRVDSSLNISPALPHFLQKVSE